MEQTATFAQRAQRRATTGLLDALCSALVVIGVAVVIVPLFLHNWVHVEVKFAPRTPLGAGLLSRLGTEVDTQVAAITAREVAAATSPTLWQYPGIVFHALFALVLLAAVATLVALALSSLRQRIIVRAGAFVGCIAATLLVVVAFIRINTRIADLPAQITTAMQSNALVTQALSTTDSTPHVSGGPGWPLIVVTVGVALALIGTLSGLILALRRPGTP